MAQLFVPSELAGAGPGSGFYLAAVIDANGHLAIGYTPYWQTAAGILVPAPIDATTNSLGTHDDANGTPGSAAPATALQVGGSDGTDLRALTTDGTGHLLPPVPSLLVAPATVSTTSGAHLASFTATITGTASILLSLPTPAVVTLTIAATGGTRTDDLFDGATVSTWQNAVIDIVDGATYTLAAGAQTDAFVQIVGRVG